MSENVLKEKYIAVACYATDTERIRMYSALNKIQICDFIKMLVDDWVEKNPEFKNIPVKRDV